MIRTRALKNVIIAILIPVFFFGLVSLSLVHGAAPSVALENPIRVNSITDFLVAILNIVMILMIPIIVFFIILSGFKYVTARGNSSQTEEATQSLLYAIIGGVLILGALAIVQIIRSLVDAFVV